MSKVKIKRSKVTKFKVKGQMSRSNVKGHKGQGSQRSRSKGQSQRSTGQRSQRSRQTVKMLRSHVKGQGQNVKVNC